MYADIRVASGIEVLNIVLTVVAGAVAPDAGAAEAALLVGQNVYCKDWKLTMEVKRK